MKKIIAIEWRSARNTVGIVAVEQAHDKKWRAYIGPVVHLFPSKRYSEDEDAQRIADGEAKLNKREAVAFFPSLNPDLFDEEK